MDYLERNRRLIEEIRDVPLAKGKLIGESRKTTFHTLGVYDSVVLGQPFHLGLKTTRFERKNENDFLELRFLSDLAVIRAISIQHPHLTEELSPCNALLRDSTGSITGSIMEDFSQGATYPVRELYDWQLELLPIELRQFVSRIPDEELARIGFMVNGKRRLCDFDTMLVSLPFSQRTEVFPNDDLEATLDQYTIIRDL